MLEDEATASTDGRGRKVGSFGERMALAMHKWTWQQFFGAAQKGPKCQGGAASEANEAAEAFKDEKRSKKVHYADSSQIH